MSHAKNTSETCKICHQKFRLRDLLPTKMVRSSVSDFIAQNHKDWDHESGYICNKDLTQFRADYIRNQIEKDRGALSDLDRIVLNGLSNKDILSRNTEEESSKQDTFASRVSDQIAKFGGSWKFILTFMFIIFGWISLNTIIRPVESFDPYPYILLNLVLSCIAALQAPVIMMSQNRQEAKDRMRAEQDYIINMKAELEIRNLTAKIDQLMSNQWQSLVEIQAIQTEIMSEISGRNRK